MNSTGPDEAPAGPVAWQLAVQAANIGAFDWDLRSGELRWDDRLLAIFGMTRETFGGTIESFNAVVHPDDLSSVTAALAEAIASCGQYALRYRISLPGRATRWIAARGQALAGPDGPGHPAVRVMGAALDVTAEQDSEAQVARVLEAMPSAFYHLDRDWRFSYVNGEAERLLGRSREELLGGNVWELYPAAVDSDFDVHYRAAVASGRPVSFHAYYPEPLDGWFEVRAWPTPDGLSVYFLDITERLSAQQQVEQAAERSALLAQVTSELSGTLDTAEAVGRLAPLLVPVLADWCVVTLLETDRGASGRTLHDVGWWHADARARQWVETYARLRLSQIPDLTFLPDTLAGHEPIVLDSGATEVLASLIGPGEAREALLRLAPECVATLGLSGRDRAVGMLSVFRDPGRAPFSADDLRTLEDVAARAGLALDNARMFAEQRDLAEGLQRSLLTDPPVSEDVQIVVRYEPAAEAAQVGGDWYDAFVQEHGATVVVIGDVVGHDTAAAAAMGQVRSILRGIAVHTGDGPADVLRGVDRALVTLGVETTATAVVARLEQTPQERAEGVTRLRWSNAGHPPPVVVHPNGEVALLEAPTDLLLGLSSSARRGEHVALLREGSTVLLYTDGLIERRREPMDIGIDRLLDQCRQLVAEGIGLDETGDRLLALVPGRRDDDVALVAVRLL